MFSSKLYITKLNTFYRIKENKRRMCPTALYFYKVHQEHRLYTICAILGELAFLKTLKRQIILDVFITNLYPKMNTFYYEKKIKDV